MFKGLVHFIMGGEHCGMPERYGDREITERFTSGSTVIRKREPPGLAYAFKTSISSIKVGSPIPSYVLALLGG